MKNRENKGTKQGNPGSVRRNINGLDVTLVFAETEQDGLKEQIIDILSNEYEKKRLGKTGRNDAVKSV